MTAERLAWTVAAALAVLASTAGAAQSPVSGRVFRLQLAGRRSSEALLGVAVARDGTVWASDQADQALIAISAGGRRKRVPLGRGALSDIENRQSDVWTVGAVFIAADGSVYVGERGAIARVSDGHLRSYRIAAGRYASPGAFTQAPGGDIWFTEVNRPYIGRFDPTTGRITQFRDGTDQPGGGIAAGPDGRLWFTLPGYYVYSHSALGAITTAGRATVYRPSADGLLQGAWGIVADHGSLWVLGSRLGVASRGQPQSGLLRVTPQGRVARVGPSLGDATGQLALAPGGVFYAVGGALGASGAIVSVTEGGTVRHYGRANGQVGLFGSGANLTALAAAGDGSVWLGADDGQLEHLLPAAAAPCVVPDVVGYSTTAAAARLRHGRCMAAIGAIPGPRDTPAIVTEQGDRTSTVLDPGTRVRLVARRGIPYACSMSGDSNPTLTVLRVSCAAALELYHRVYGEAQRHGSASAEGFSCHFVKGTAIPAMGGGEVACRGHDRQGQLRVADMFYAPPR